MSNDADPAFLSVFYRFLKIMSQDLYRLSPPSTALPLLSRPMASPALNRSGSFARTNSSTFGAESLGGLHAMAEDVMSTSSKRPSMKRDASARGVGSGSGGGGGGDDDRPVAGESGARAPSKADYFSEDNIRERMLLYARESGGSVPEALMRRYLGGND